MKLLGNMLLIWDLGTRRSLFTLQSVTVPDVAQKRNEWIEKIEELDADKCVFIDESGVNIDMTRHYGRAVGKERAVDKTPENTPTNTTILSSIRLNGETAYTTYTGGTTGDRFVDYLEKTLIPTLNKGDIVPPYSPDFNPIEKMWSKIKSILRKLKARNVKDLPKTIETAFSCIAQSDCIGWFNSCGVSC